jgi:hypothetical protein
MSEKSRNELQQAAVDYAWRERKTLIMSPVTPTEEHRARAAELVRIARENPDDAQELVANALWLRDLPVHPAFSDEAWEAARARQQAAKQNETV